MKICIPILSNNKKGQVSPTFARSSYFAIIDQQLDKVEIISNPFLNVKQNLGNKLINWLLNEYNVDTLLAFELGVKVQQIANEHQMQLIIINEKNQTLKQLLEYLKIT